MKKDMQPTLGKKNLGHIGFGAMRLPGIRDVPADAELAHSLLSHAVALGAQFLDIICMLPELKAL